MMNRATNSLGKGRLQRGGFTLIELMVVISIIGILMALTAGASIRFINTQRRSNTQRLVKKLAGMLQRQQKAALDDLPSTIPAGVLQMANGDQDLARVIWTKLWYKKEFPQNFAEAVNPVGGNPYGIVLGPQKFYVNALQGASGSNPPGPAESGACLLLALSVQRRGASSEIDTLTSSETAPLNQGGLKTIVDAWGTPVAFYRSPTGNPDVDALDPRPNDKNRDPLDPMGKLLNPGWNNATNFTNQGGVFWFEQMCHSVHTTVNGTYTPISFYCIPAITSAGPNKALGLDSYVMAVTDQNAANDNINSYDK